MELRIFALIMAIIGVSFLIGMLIWPNYELVVDMSDLQKLEINDQVVLIGKVQDVRDFGGFFVMDVNDIDVVYNCDEECDYSGKDVEVKGLVSVYESKKQIEVLRMRVLEP